DIVTLCPGTYIESVVVHQEVTIRSNNGAATTLVQAADPGATAFEIRRSGVTIEGLTITGSHRAIAVDEICPLGTATCSVSQGSSVRIRDNAITANSSYGVEVNRKVDCLLISGNQISLNGFAGVVVAAQQYTSAFVSILGNVVSDSLTGIDVSAAGPRLLIAQNTVEGMTVQAVRAAHLTAGANGDGNQLLENEIRNSTIGVFVGTGGESLRVLMNNITGNGVGLENDAPDGPLDATLNWWGSNTGPFHS